MRKAAIYHFTNHSEIRPKIYKDQLTALETYAFSLGYDSVDIFCDMSLKVCEHAEFKRFLSCSDQYDALIVKSFYHISKNTGKLIESMRTLQEKGLSVYSPEDGIFTWEIVPLTAPLRVVTYTILHGTPNEMKEILPVRNDILRLFTEKKTRWTIADQYYDKTLYQRHGEQTSLSELVANKERYDLLLVHKLNDINWHTARFLKVRNELRLDIYSLQEGYLKYRKENPD